MIGFYYSIFGIYLTLDEVFRLLKHKKNPFNIEEEKRILLEELKDISDIQNDVYDFLPSYCFPQEMRRSDGIFISGLQHTSENGYIMGVLISTLDVYEGRLTVVNKTTDKFKEKYFKKIRNIVKLVRSGCSKKMDFDNEYISFMCEPDDCTCCT